MMCDCPECLSDVLRDDCTWCDGSGQIKDYDEEWPCRACNDEAAEQIIKNRESLRAVCGVQSVPAWQMIKDIAALGGIDAQNNRRTK